MTSPKPLTREELADLDMIATDRYSCEVSRETLHRLIAQCRRCLKLEAKQEERDDLEQRRDRWLAVDDHDAEGLGWVCDERHNLYASGKHVVTLTRLGEHREGTGPTYEAALAAALSKLEKPNG